MNVDMAVKVNFGNHDVDTCVDGVPIIRFQNEEERVEAMRHYFEVTNGIPYLISAIDGTIILVEKMSDEEFMSDEFFNPRKGHYSVNTMIICDHRKKILFVDARWRSR